jgi:hypothetical protein
MQVEPDQNSLRYLEPERAEIGRDRCDGMTVKDTTGNAVGHLEGFVVDPPARRLRYFVVKEATRRADTMLIPVSAARVNVDDRAIEVLDDAELEQSQPFSPSMYPSFSDDDLIAALFRRGESHS